MAQRSTVPFQTLLSLGLISSYIPTTYAICVDRNGNVVSSFNCVPAAKIGIAIAVFVIFIFLLCCCKIAQRRRVTAANLAYIQNQPQTLPPAGGYPPSPYAPGVYNGTPLQPGQAYVYTGPQQYQPPPGPPPAPPYDPSSKPAYDPTNAPQYPPPTYSKDGPAAER